MNVTLIYNPDAGSDNQPTDDEILKLIRSAGHSAQFQSSNQIGWEKALENLWTWSLSQAVTALSGKSPSA